MKAVMWTDVFQIIIMFAGLFAILIKGSSELGGFGNVWEYLEDGDRVQFLKYVLQPCRASRALVFACPCLAQA